MLRGLDGRVGDVRTEGVPHLWAMDISARFVREDMSAAVQGEGSGADNLARMEGRDHEWGKGTNHGNHRLHKGLLGGLLARIVYVKKDSTYLSGRVDRPRSMRFALQRQL